MPTALHRSTYCHEKWRRNPFLPPRFFQRKRIKNFHFNMGLETGVFSPGDRTNLPLMQPRDNTLYYTPISNQYNSPRIYCLFCTLVWQVLIRTEFSFRRGLRNSSFIFFRCDFIPLMNKISSFSLKFLLLNENQFENISRLIHIY